MSYLVDSYHGETVAAAPASERVAFIRRTYAHVAAAVLTLVAFEAVLISTGIAKDIVSSMFASNFAWLGLMVVFIGGTFAAQYMARSRSSIGMQYAGLALYVLLYGVLFMPILTIASLPQYGGGQLPLQAGIVTLAVFGGLTVAVFVSGKDFSFLGPVLFTCTFLALGVIISALVFGFSLGLVFCALMVALMSGYIIYDTSNIIHRYGTNEHVAASMALFGSVALLFYYILRIFMSVRDE